MRKLLFLFGLLLTFAGSASAQFTVVSGTITDPSGLAYANGTISPALVTSGTPIFTATKTPYSPPTQPVGLSAAGSFVMRLADVTALTPGGSTWTFTVCSGAGSVQPAQGRGPVCFTVTGVSISGGSQDIGATLSAAAPALTFGGGSSSGTVTSVGSGTGLTGGPISTTGSLSLITPVAVANGGTGTGSTLTGLVRGGNPLSATEISGDCSTSGSNAITCTKTSGTAFGPLATATTPLSVANGGSGTASTLSGVMRGGSPMSAAEMSGDCTTLGSNSLTCTKSNGIPFAAVATSGSASDITTGLLPLAQMNNGAAAQGQIPYVQSGATSLGWLSAGATGCILDMSALAVPQWDAGVCFTSGTLAVTGTVTASAFIGTGPWEVYSVLPSALPSPIASNTMLAFGPASGGGLIYPSYNGAAFSGPLVAEPASPCTNGQTLQKTATAGLWSCVTSSSATLSSIGDPTANKTFSMGTHSLGFTWSGATAAISVPFSFVGNAGGSPNLDINNSAATNTELCVEDNGIGCDGTALLGVGGQGARARMFSALHGANGIAISDDPSTPTLAAVGGGIVNANQVNGAAVAASASLAATNASRQVVTATSSANGDVWVGNGTSFTRLAGNNSGTKVLQEDASGNASWATAGGIGGSGTTNSLAKFTASTTIGNAAAADVVAAFSGCSGTLYLGADGACHSSSGTAPLSHTGSTASSDQLTAAGTFATTQSISGSGVAAGSTIEIHAHGVYTTTTTASPVLNLQVNAGGTTGICPAVSNISLSTSQVNGVWELDCYIEIVTTGTPGTAYAYGGFQAATAAGAISGSRKFFVNASTVNYTTSSPQTVSIQETGTAVSGQTYNLQILDTKVIY